MSTIIVTESVVEILGWPTDTVSIDWKANHNGVSTVSSNISPHSYILFIPGNPGLVGWYIDALSCILEQLGPGYAIRGVSYAGHGITTETVSVEDYECNNHSSSNNNNNNSNQSRNVNIPWTVRGQIEHKIAWIDQLQILSTTTTTTKDGMQKNNNLIFISHSIGSFLVQRLLVLREDIRHQTYQILHWMPFIRMDAPSWYQRFKLNLAAQYYPDLIIAIGKFLLRNIHNPDPATSSTSTTARRLLSSSVPDPKGLDLAVRLVQHETFVRNFLELGGEEIRDLPNVTDIPALRILSSIPTHILYCSNDHWFPEHHAQELSSLCSNTILPNLHLEYVAGVKHDFVVYPDMVPKAVDFCVRAIRGKTNHTQTYQQQEKQQQQSSTPQKPHVATTTTTRPISRL